MAQAAPERRSRRGYAQPWPHHFSGRALYQLCAVPVAEARKFVPAGLPLVEAFGYTLGGIYLARYDSSPVGAFDEMVLLGGLVWNPPTSCAWAARVYVTDADARKHGVQEVGLPSRLARFVESSGSSPAGGAVAGTQPTWWRPGERGGGGALALSAEDGDAVCTLRLPPAPRRPGFRLSLALPSFSGRTPARPELLRYSLDLRAAVTPCAPIRVETAAAAPARAAAAAAPRARAQPQRDSALLAALLGARPLVTLAFDDMSMSVGAPAVVGGTDGARGGGGGAAGGR